MGKRGEAGGEERQGVRQNSNFLLFFLTNSGRGKIARHEDPFNECLRSIGGDPNTGCV
jgi:hypothetical protein